MTELFTNIKQQCELRNKLQLLLQNRIKVGIGFFELSCCAEDAYMVNVGYKKEDEFRKDWDGYVCGYMDCIDINKFHLHVELLNPNTDIKNIADKLNGNIIDKCDCYKSRDSITHHLTYTIEMTIYDDDIKFLEEFYTYLSC